MISQTTAHARHPQPSRPRWWRRRGPRAASLTLALTLTAGTASGLAAAPAWAAGGYHITYVGVGRYPASVAVSPNGARAYVTNEESNTVSVIDTATRHVTATISVGSGPLGVAVSPVAPAPTSPANPPAPCR